MNRNIVVHYHSSFFFSIPLSFTYILHAFLSRQHGGSGLHMGREWTTPAGQLIEQAGAQKPPEEGLSSLVRPVPLARGRQRLNTPRTPPLCAPERLESQPGDG